MCTLQYHQSLANWIGNSFFIFIFFNLQYFFNTKFFVALFLQGKAIKIGDKEIEYNPSFFLILQTKLANPHYKPEMQAQTTLINFTVTRDGLEEQLLAAVVRKERPDLEKLKSELTHQQNEFKITLKVRYI